MGDLFESQAGQKSRFKFHAKTSYQHKLKWPGLSCTDTMFMLTLEEKPCWCETIETWNLQHLHKVYTIILNIIQCAKFRVGQGSVGSMFLFATLEVSIFGTVFSLPVSVCVHHGWVLMQAEVSLCTEACLINPSDRYELKDHTYPSSCLLNTDTPRSHVAGDWSLKCA